MRRLPAMTALPELLQRRATKLLDSFCAEAARHPQEPRRLDYRIEGEQLSLFETLRSCCGNHQQVPIARIRFHPQLNQWTLHHRQGERWPLYLNVTPSLDLGKLLTAIRQDPWGDFRSE
jgi:hypothetical protein